MGWMRNWARRRAQRRSRAVFRFWDGQRYQDADPLEVYRLPSTHDKFDWASHPQLVDQDDHEATKLTVQTVREIFHVPEFTAGGLTEGECIALLIQYVEYLQSVKKKVSHSPIWRDATEAQSSQTPSDATESSDSDSGSTSNEPRSDEPEDT